MIFFTELAGGNTTGLTAVLLAVLTTLSTAILLAAGAFLWKQFKKTLSEGRADMQVQLNRIETQTTRTNGKVGEAMKDIEALKSDMRVEQAKTKLLTDIYLRMQPDHDA